MVSPNADNLNGLLVAQNMITSNLRGTFSFSEI